MAEDTTPSESSSPPTQITTPRTLSLWDKVTNFLSAAMFWLGFGFKVIPIGPGTKITSEKWEPWFSDFDPKKVYDFWTSHQKHEVGFIVGDDTIVFDADGPESVAAIRDIEARFGIEPKLVVKTKKGEHHHFRLAAGTIAKSDSHSSEKHPDRIDIKTGRNLVILPNSTGKSILSMTAENKEDLSEATQAFIDAIYVHNGRTAPSEVKSLATPRVNTIEPDDVSIKKLEILLNSIDPDCGYHDWVNVLMGVYHETNGSDDGLALVDSWSRRGKKYKDSKDVETKWRSFRDDVENKVTIGTLIMMARDAEAFEICEGETIFPAIDAPSKPTDIKTPLTKYSLQGRVDDLEKRAMEQVLILGNIALLSQSTAIYAKPNTGKTLIVLHLIIEAIKQNKIDPSKLYYINMDDDNTGLILKARLAEEYGFQMIADGHHGFEASVFRDALEKMIETDTAGGVIIILDTLKRFVDTMNKGKTSHFTKFTRQFSLKGGTVIALAHTNKNPGSDGKPVYAGTTDIVDDFDCAYTMSVVSEDVDTNQKVVEFSNFKRRGNVALTEAYSYAQDSDISYHERLLSVQQVDPDQLELTKLEVETKTDAEVIAAIEFCITSGINTKMQLATHAAERAKISKRHALKIIEKYTGNDPAIHRWTFEVKERGAKVFRLPERPTVQPPDPAMATP